jgi:phosphatidylglycerophosphate synthase
MQTLIAIAKIATFIDICAILAIIFFLAPGAMDRLRAKAPSRFDFRWWTVGWLMEPEAAVSLGWFLLGFALAALAALLDYVSRL